MTSFLLSFTLLVALLLGLEVGRWLRLRRGLEEEFDSSTADGVVFAVLGLIIAFTFTSAASRFDRRRDLIIEQANAIGTAWMRIDLLPAGDREAIRKPMREWARLSVEVLPKISDTDNAGLAQLRSQGQALQNEAWAAAVAAVDRNPRPQYAGLILSPMNDWIDFSSTRAEMNNLGLPPLVLPTLFALSLAGSVLAGYRLAKRPKRSPLHIVAFAGSIAFCVYVIIDLNHPRSGLIQVDAADDAMVQAYQSMGN